MTSKQQFEFQIVEDRETEKSPTYRFPYKVSEEEVVKTTNKKNER